MREFGFFLIDKPEDWTSYDVVRFLKKKFNLRKVGHAGTLDPFATGLLIILVGKFTKKFDYFQKQEKEYEAVVFLGKTTDTYDVEGKVTSKFKGKIGLKKEKVLKVLKSFEGEIKQVPPIFSALKVKGKPAYRLARKGQDLKLEPRKVFIKKIDLQKIDPPRIYIKVTCSSGTYVRSLAYDIGEKLGFGAFLEKLVRTKIGNFILKDAKIPTGLTINDLKTNIDS